MSAVTLRQHEYRALMMYDTLPAGCIAHLVTDSYSLPHIRPGEFVVVDTTDRAVRHLETYVIEWRGGRRSVCEAVAREFDWCDPTIPRQGWSVRSITGLRGCALTGYIERCVADGTNPESSRIGWCDGPFRSDDGHLHSKLVGCVIGLFQPTFEDPARAA